VRSLSQEVIAESVPSQAEGKILPPPHCTSLATRLARRAPTVFCLISIPAYSAGAELTLGRRRYAFPFYAGEPEGIEFVRLVPAHQA
jgi:hypothetical protein